jgi:hypothetical protein
MVEYILAREEYKLTIRRAEQASKLARIGRSASKRSLADSLVSRFGR